MIMFISVFDRRYCGTRRKHWLPAIDLLFPQCFQRLTFNSLPSGIILDVTNMRAFAQDKLNIGKMTISLYDGVENTVGKGQNAGYQHFLLFPQCFPKPSSLGLLKVGIVWERVNTLVCLLKSHWGWPLQHVLLYLYR